MAEKITMPRRNQKTEGEAPRGQRLPELGRYRLHVDQQMKLTYDDKAAAEKTGQEIKRKFPIVQVTIYDSKTEERTIL
jgi:hypothetical protein